MNIWQVSAPVELVRQMEAMRVAQAGGAAGQISQFDDNTVLAALMAFLAKLKYYFLI